MRKPLFGAVNVHSACLYTHTGITHVSHVPLLEKNYMKGLFST